MDDLFYSKLQEDLECMFLQVYRFEISKLYQRRRQEIIIRSTP